VQFVALDEPAQRQTVDGIEIIVSQRVEIVSTDGIRRRRLEHVSMSMVEYT
jgi:hypothetical protein